VKFLHRFYLILQSQYLTFHPRYSCLFKHQLNFLWKNSLTYTDKECRTLDKPRGFLFTCHLDSLGSNLAKYFYVTHQCSSIVYGQVVIQRSGSNRVSTTAGASKYQQLTTAGRCNLINRFCVRYTLHKITFTQHGMVAQHVSVAKLT